MNSTQKVLVKLEICRSLLCGVWSDEAAPTIEWMKSEFDRAFSEIGIDAIPRAFAKDRKAAQLFIDDNTDVIRDLVPETIPALFMVSCITHILGDLEGTNKYKYVENIVDGSYGLEEFVDKDRIEDRESAAAFSERIDFLIGMS